ncbi:MAG: hypothetical protein J6S62_00875 [Bacteroidales bacterium]|nr:hypothetical protein [Bacteroidales bacterium]
MRTVLRLLIPALAAICLCSCSKSFQDIKVTSCELVSLSPVGLSAMDLNVNVGVDNPTVQVTLSQLRAVIKMDGVPCLNVTADDVVLAAKTEDVYPLLLHGSIAEGFNPLQLLGLIGLNDLSPLTADVAFHGALRSGLGKDFEYTDISLKDLLEKL